MFYVATRDKENGLSSKGIVCVSGHFHHIAMLKACEFRGIQSENANISLSTSSVFQEGAQQPSYNKQL